MCVCVCLTASCAEQADFLKNNFSNLRHSEVIAHRPQIKI